jgi:hypothetical protein
MNRSDYLKGKERPLYLMCGVKFTDDFCRYIGHPSMPSMRGHIVGEHQGKWVINWGPHSEHQNDTIEAKENIVRATDAPPFQNRMIIIDTDEFANWNIRFEPAELIGMRTITYDFGTPE